MEFGPMWQEPFSFLKLSEITTDVVDFAINTTDEDEMNILEYWHERAETIIMDCQSSDEAIFTKLDSSTIYLLV